MNNRLANAWTWSLTVLLVIVGFLWMSIVFLLTAPFDPGRYIVGRWFRRVGVAQVSLNPLWHFETRGVRITDPRRPYVAVSNHESYADIFLISHLPWEMKWLAKASLFTIPVFGWMMRMAGDIPIRRTKRDSRRDALDACRDRLTKRVSVMIFPEGTRSADGALLPFRDGAFILALESGAPILPIAVVGTSQGMAKGTFQFRRARAICEVLPPVETAGLDRDQLPRLKAEVRATIIAARARLRAELGLPPADSDETPDDEFAVSPDEASTSELPSTAEGTGASEPPATRDAAALRAGDA